jgi:hypothetical protein
VLEDRLLLYLDAALLLDREITGSSGYFGLRVHGSPETRCEVSDMWVYSVSANAASGCEIVADSGAANQRSGPGTAFEIVGLLEPDLRAQVLAQAVGPDHLIWWQLEDESWVREDVVRESGACATLPLNN